MELEDAEQAYYSQWLRWGYDDQPPLYTWLQYAVNQVFGVHKISFSMLRGAIFAGVLLALSNFAEKMFPNQKKSEITVLLLVLLPVFIDFTFRRLSHTSLLCLSILVSVILVQKLLKEKTWANYALLGLVVSIGMLSKYNYILFLGALVCLVFFDASIRKIVFDRKFLLTVFLILLFLFPHFYWLFEHEAYVMELRESIALKTENTLDTKLFVLGPLYSLALTLMKFMALIFAIFILALVFRKVKFQKSKLDWFAKLALSQILILALFFVFMNVQKVEERWLLPLLLSFIILLLRSIEFKSVRKWNYYLYIAFISVIIIQTLRTPVEKVLNIPSSVHFGFEPLSDRLNSDFENQPWLLPDVTYGGNIRILNPTKEIFSRDDFSLPSSKLQDVKMIEVVIGTENQKWLNPLGTILEFGMERDTLYFLQY